MRKCLFTILLTAMAVGTRAQESQTAYNFLRLPESAHAAALGGDNISIIEDDATLALSNPALLASVGGRTVTVGYMNYMDGVGMYTANYADIINDKATVGGAIHYINYGTMKEVDQNDVQTGTFSAADMAFEGLFSYTLAKNLVGGIGAKFIYSKIGGYTSTAAAIDLGLNYYSADKDFSASISVRNLGGQLSTYEDEFESLPTDVSVGVTYGLPNSPLRLSLTFTDLNHWDYAFLRHACVGVDLKLTEQFYVAGGYNARRAYNMKTRNLTDNSESSHGAGFTVGAGLLLERFKLNVSYGKYHVNSSSIMLNAAINL